MANTLLSQVEENPLYQTQTSGSSGYYSITSFGKPTLGYQQERSNRHDYEEMMPTGYEKMMPPGYEKMMPPDYENDAMSCSTESFDEPEVPCVHASIVHNATAPLPRETDTNDTDVDFETVINTFNNIIDESGPLQQQQCSNSSFNFDNNDRKHIKMDKEGNNGEQDSGCSSYLSSCYAQSHGILLSNDVPSNKEKVEKLARSPQINEAFLFNQNEVDSDSDSNGENGYRKTSNKKYVFEEDDEEHGPNEEQQQQQQQQQQQPQQQQQQQQHRQLTLDIAQLNSDELKCQNGKGIEFYKTRQNSGSSTDSGYSEVKSNDMTP